MLILSRRIQETIIIGTDIKVCVLGFDNMSVRLGISAPRAIPIHRSEIFTKILEQKIKHLDNKLGQPDMNQNYQTCFNAHQRIW
jgi:carbon storage regulator